MSGRPSWDDWQKAIADATKVVIPPSDALSIAELAELHKCSRAKATRIASLLVAQGRATKTTKYVAFGIDAMRRAPAYLLKRERTDASRRSHARRDRSARPRARQQRRRG